MMDTTRVKEQIRKLLNLANDDAAAAQEAENALMFARRLMLRHNIDESELEEARSPHEIAADIEYADSAAYSNFTRLMPWEATLSMAIADLIGTTKVYTETSCYKRTDNGTMDFDAKGQQQLRTKVVFYGPEDDCRDARDLFNEWSAVIMAMARMKFGQAIRGDGRAYAAGFAQALYDKVEHMRAKERHALKAGDPQLIESTGGGTALVLKEALALVEAKRERADIWLEESKGIKLRKRSATGPGFGADAYGQGKADGSNASFSHTKTKRLQG